MSAREKVKKALRKKKLSQKDVAERLGVSQAQVSRILGGERGPTTEVAAELAKLAGDEALAWELMKERPESRVGEPRRRGSRRAA